MLAIGPHVWRECFICSLWPTVQGAAEAGRERGGGEGETGAQEGPTI